MLPAALLCAVVVGAATLGSRQSAPRPAHRLEFETARRNVAPIVTVNAAVVDTLDVNLVGVEASWISASGWPSCRIVVGDSQGERVHLLSTEGELEGSFSTIVKGRSLGDRLLSLSGNDSRIIVANMTWNTITAFDTSGALLWSSPAATGVAGSDPAAHVTLLSGGGSAETWLSRRTRYDSGTWPDELPLISMRDSLGRVVRRVGKVTRFPGNDLTALLNAGALSSRADTLFYSRYADGRVFVFPPGTGASLPADTIELPLYYATPAAVEYEIRGRVVGLRLDFHTGAFTVADNYFIYAQAVSYPPEDDSGPYVPDEVLTVYDRRTGIARAVDLDAMIRSVSVADGTIYVVARGMVRGDRQLLSIRGGLESPPHMCPQVHGMKDPP